ncbi:MAG: hypothetical protein H0X17_03860 [Deltaproteobacteria bacterium]|nr:hypothetical protein [Deltaproteobacteria bacterium]
MVEISTNSTDVSSWLPLKYCEISVPVTGSVHTSASTACPQRSATRRRWSCTESSRRIAIAIRL